MFSSAETTLVQSKIDRRHMAGLVNSMPTRDSLLRSIYKRINLLNDGISVPSIDSPLLRDVSIPAVRVTAENNAEIFSMEHAGFIIERYENAEMITDNQPEKTIFISQPSMQTIIDTEVKYGKFYTYCTKNVFRVRYFREERNDANQIQRVLYTAFFSSQMSDPATVKVHDNLPPKEPDGVFYRFNFNNRKGLVLTWQYPLDLQRDIKYYQIFRRRSIHEPFTCIAELDFDNSTQKSAKRESVRIDRIIKYQDHVCFYEDATFRKNSNYIYAVASVDAHGLTSPYSAQTRVTFNKEENRLIAETVSPAGAPKQYPNFFVDPDSDSNVFVNTITQDVIKTSGFSKMRVYFDPDAMHVRSRDENLFSADGEKHVFPTTEGGEVPVGVLKIPIIDLDRQKSQVLEIQINDARQSGFF